MRKHAFFLLFTLIPGFVLFAQRGELVAKSSDKGLYLEHKVVAKETYYSIGRLYNLHPKSIAGFNKLEMNKGLNIDQKIRIPLLDTNFTQRGNTGTPVYYKVGDNEELSSVSRKINNVPPASLIAWNNLSGDKLKKDSKLIIGFLMSREMKSVTIKSSPPAADPAVSTEVQPDPAIAVAEDISKKEEKKIAEAEVKSEEKKEAPAVKEIRKPLVEGQGYFKTHFEQQVRTQPAVKDETVTAGIFKTTSGWEDAKYYLLIDKVQPGTIVKVINPATNRAVYAKVLGEMAGIRQNEGFDIRISNAAASALEISEQDKFIVKVNY